MSEPTAEELIHDIAGKYQGFTPMGTLVGMLDKYAAAAREPWSEEVILAGDHYMVEPGAADEIRWLQREVERLKAPKPPHPNASLENIRWYGEQLEAARAEGYREGWQDGEMNTRRLALEEALAIADEGYGVAGIRDGIRAKLDEGESDGD